MKRWLFILCVTPAMVAFALLNPEEAGTSTDELCCVFEDDITE